MPLFDVKISENLVIGHIDDNEIFRLTFNPQTFFENFHKSVAVRGNDEESKSRMRHLLGQLNPEKAKTVTKTEIETLSFEFNKIVFEEKAGHIAFRISENLRGIIITAMEDAIQAYSLEASILLNEQAGKPISISKYKKILLDKHWSHIRNLAGIKRGGSRIRKGFVWTSEKKYEFYKKVDSLPQYHDKSVWQYLLDTETVVWLKTRPFFKGIPENLVDSAVKAWRKYLSNDDWESMEEKDKARAFEFRHALFLLNYPDKFKYSTLETYYYEGKKLSENQK
jgi:hypothetical protein